MALVCDGANSTAHNAAILVPDSGTKSRADAESYGGTDEWALRSAHRFAVDYADGFADDVTAAVVLANAASNICAVGATIAIAVTHADLHEVRGVAG